MNIYHQNIPQCEAEILKLSRSLKRFSLFRLAAFILSISLIVILISRGLVNLSVAVAPVCVLGFGWLVNRYNRISYLIRHVRFFKEINESEISRLRNELVKFPGGEGFVQCGHPYLSDLDIFGKHSLFQLMNRTTTDSANSLLAEWLSAPASRKTILERQKAVKELTPRLNWRQNFQASGMHFKHPDSDYNKLVDWLEKPVQLLPRQTWYFLICIPLSGISTIAAIYFAVSLFTANLFIGAVAGSTPIIISFLINSLVLKRANPIAEEATENIYNNINILGGYQTLITQIESEKFQSEVLQQLQSAFAHGGYSAAVEIKKLRRILEVFQQRGNKKDGVSGNAFYGIFNALWFLDIYLILLTEKWKNKNRPYLRKWASAVSEFEVLSSLAGFSFSNPSFAFPKITEDPYVIHFKKVGHPLLHADKRVCNTFDLEGQGQIAMITGSNMSGKSTFLRTVGVNLVLAFMGAPCCATSGEVSLLQLFTSMRTQDNLEEGISSFRAELKRIEQLLNLIESGQPVFFLLDEMFKGTNSEDRYKGGVSLIKQLSELNAFGIISTHDLSLANLADSHMIVSNYNFYSKIQEGEMIFNYELAEGICNDFNASELMKKSGIKVLSDDGKQSAFEL